MNSPAGSSYSYTPVDLTGSATDLLALAQRYPQRYPFLLESVAAGPQLARYDILFAFPGTTLELAADGTLRGPYAQHGGFLSALDAWWADERIARSSAEVPFTGGWFVFLGYALAGEIEPTLTIAAAPAMPVAFATRVPVAVIHDSETGAVGIVAEPGHAARVAQVLADLQGIAAQPQAAAGLPAFSVHEDDEQAFIDAVARAQCYIAAGDIFQANLSRCWQVKMQAAVAPTELYRRLRQTNPAPFGGLIQRDDFALVSSSPERLVRRRGERLDTRPIAGTRPRAEAPAGLLAHPKERAEHIMLIDLERNDLGRVCTGGSVRVDEYMVIESYTHVHHIVSNVTGTARPGLTPGELIRAVFPGGTITGCPKVRCMAIINELEQRPRGAYTGSMGYLNRDGDCDLNILIRTMQVQGRQVEIAAGSGIVADSRAQRELDETRAKAKGLLLALQDPGALPHSLAAGNGS